MDYLFENLGDERFQEFCHSLINKEFPDSQAYPVGQPDGGRDSLVYSMDSNKKEFIVFQVKFVRNPYQITDVHKWLTSVIENEKGEAKKINLLIPKGAIKYYLLTNVKGTAHLDVGAIDKVNKILEDNIEIPSICWWRDDLSRKLESNPILKWSYPEILSGQDILNSVLFNNLNESKERRENVIRAYLADQYEIDNEVKFKQIDLHSQLLDLFTDVPIRIKKFNQKNRLLRRIIGSFEDNQFRYNNDYYIPFDEEEPRTKIGTAEFLLHPKFQNEIQRILLEGGPGQGKSTISQYVCQTHRIRLLDKQNDLEKLPDNIKNAPIRLPFKIDLRDIASWVEKKNPYPAIISEEHFSKNWNNSLESFLVAHIFNHSQLENFNTNDFIAVCKLSSILFVFDGFDEIANIKIREEVIEFINKGINRISENSKSIQVVITSRPAAFSSSISFSVDLYPHFELADITPLIIKQYVEKWIKANRLDSKESAQIKKLIDEKLQMPHLKDLAKSPMQLAIFLSLLRTNSESLPNKRTALYDTYINLFFNRESEKNTMIRDNRDLIIDIHQYLAWILHSEAEMSNNSGRIYIEDLINLLKNYLSKEGHRTDISEELFDVLKERVCALVSRVQGTFEFEVQPLREYFCARYLYNTSPYSPAGSEKSGTKPERFEAISRSFYWQNVVRFFAGCFDKGELPMLIQKLRELQNDKFLKYTNYPRLLTSQILSDYVFTQYPILLRDVVEIIIDGINIGAVINQESHRSSKEPILLPQECGRSEVIDECFKQLRQFPPIDYAQELIGIINNNPQDRLVHWKDHIQKIQGEKLTKWLEYAYLLQIIHKIDKQVLADILKLSEDELELKKRIQILINGNRLDVIEDDIKFKQLLIQEILESNVFLVQRAKLETSYQILSLSLLPFIFSHLIDNYYYGRSYLDFVNRIIGLRDYNSIIENSKNNFNPDDITDVKIKGFYESVEDVLKTNQVDWKHSIKPWDILVENGRHFWGDNWVFSIISVLGAGIKSKEERFDEFDDLTNNSLSLCKRVRCARLKSGNIKYWKSQLQDSNMSELVLLTFFTWATPKTIISLLPFLSSKLNSSSSIDLLKLVNGIKQTISQSSFTKSQEELLESVIKKGKFSNLLKYLISFRYSGAKRNQFIYDYIDDDENIENIREAKLKYLISTFLTNTKNEEILDEIKVYYNKMMNLDEAYNYSYYPTYRNNNTKLPIEISRKIMEESKNYPRILASLAETSCKIYANKQIKSVGEIAKKDKWFE